MDEYTCGELAWELLCPGLPEEVARARRWTRDVLINCPCADDAALIVTELATNTVTHTASPHFRLTIHRTTDAITLSVTDNGSSTTSPHITRAHDHETHGRGLEIVATLAQHLSVTRNPYGHTVTAELLTHTGALPTHHQAPTC